MPGFGSGPFGAMPFGLGPPAEASAPGGKILRDPATDTSTGSLRIDPYTRDYVVDEHGRTLGMPDVRQLVALAVMTARNSSTLQGFGLALGSIDVIADGMDVAARALIEEALSHLTARRLVELLRVAIEPIGPGARGVRFWWRDLTTGLEYASEF